MAAGLDGNSARRDFLTYALSLMRSHNDEHSDNLPIIDISALRHVAYVFDALIYYMRSGTDSDTDVIRDGISVHSWQDHDENENEDQDDETVGQNVTMETDSIDGESDVGVKSGRKHPFFQRTDSTTFLGCPPPDPFQGPLAEALPLADQPHLLQPNARREDLFGMPRQPITVAQPEQDLGTGHPSPFDRLPTHLALSVRTVDTPFAHGAPLPTFQPTPQVDVPSSVTPGPSATPAETSSGAAGTSVIVKPSSSQAPTPVLPPGDAPPQTVPMNLSSDASLERSPVAVVTESSHVPVATTGSPTRPVVTQPSVIVHAGSAQPIVLPSGGAKLPPEEDPAKEPRPSTSAVVPMETNCIGDQASGQSVADM